MTNNILDILTTILPAIGWAFLPFLLLPFIVLLWPHKFICDLQSGLNRLIDGFNVRIAEAAKWLLVFMVVSIAFGVIALSIFGKSWTKLDESAIYLHASVIMLGAAATLLADEHVRVDIFYSRMSPNAKALVNFIGFYAFLLPFCIILLWNSGNFVGLAWQSLEGSAESDGIQGLFLLKTLIPIFALMLLAQGFSLAGRAALFLREHPLPPLPKGMTSTRDDGGLDIERRKTGP